MQKQRFEKRQQIDIGFFLLLLFVVAGVMLRLFYHQTTGNVTLYHSDMKAYILEMQGLDSGYEFPYPVFFKLSAFFHLFTNPQLAVAIATMVLNSLSIVITKIIFQKTAGDIFGKHFGKYPFFGDMIISVISVSLYFISMLFPPGNLFYFPGIKYKYLGVFTANPFHNATYMAARPFAVLAFVWYVKLLDNYEEGYTVSKRKDYFLFSFFLLTATMTKPSFTIVLVGAAGLIMVYRMFKTKFRNFIPTVQLGLCFIPTFLDLLYQFKGVFVPKEGEVGGIGFCFGDVWKLYCDNIFLAIFLAIGFPLLVLVLNWKEIKKDTLYRFSWQIYGMSFAMAFFIYEKGFREPDFNFSWGYMYGIFFVFFSSLLLLLRKTKEKQKASLLILQWLGYFAHVICGLIYFSGIYQGGMYY